MIGIHIGLTGFLEAAMPEVMFNLDGKILEGLVIVKKICAELIFGRCIGSD